MGAIPPSSLLLTALLCSWRHLFPGAPCVVQCWWQVIKPQPRLLNKPMCLSWQPAALAPGFCTSYVQMLLFSVAGLTLFSCLTGPARQPCIAMKTSPIPLQWLAYCPCSLKCSRRLPHHWRNLVSLQTIRAGIETITGIAASIGSVFRVG